MYLFAYGELLDVRMHSVMQSLPEVQSGTIEAELQHKLFVHISG